MRLLVDTQVYLWYLADSRKLTKKASEQIASAIEVYVSAASIWEAAIKAGIGKLTVAMPDLVSGISASGFLELPVSAAHAARVSKRSDHHRDPFDRLLIAQALHEPLRLLTADAVLARYSDVVVLI